MADAESPEVTVSSERVYQGKRISVRLEHVRLSDGTESTRDIVDHPDAVVILAVDDEGNVLFVRQYRKAPEVELLELPAGVMDPGETEPLKSAQRELREETGYAAGELTPLGSFYSAPGTMTELLYCFLARQLTYDPLPADDDERIELERMSFADAVAAARAGLFQDSKTLASLFLAAPYLSNE
ncbi:MAG: NUDIX hydrolase [Chloroflexi bacterium]|nr:NUDIX hydrolase [Chloroflexota bacterium]MDA1174565.1 NUDIX hydrolase [Chloroflexota bacterium]